MLCQNCKKNNASVHYKSNINGNVVEKYLCSECAKKEGVSPKNDLLHMDFMDGFFGQDPNNIFGGLFAGMMNENQKKTPVGANVCSGCGMRLSDFLHGGKIGCAECYETFSSALSATVKRLHGATSHCGKIPKGREQKVSNKKKIESLQEKLNSAIEKQEYEMAVKYRDEIRALEDKGEN